MFSNVWNFLNNRARSLTVLTHVWLLMFMYTYPRAMQAATFAEDMRDYDYESLLWAIATGLLGGFARTLVSLASDKLIVNNVWKEAAKDAVVSIIAGGAALIIIEVLRATYWPTVPSAVRFAFILFAGASRIAFFGQVNTFITKIIDAGTNRIVGKFGQEKLTKDFEDATVGQAQAVMQSIVATASTTNYTPVDPTLVRRIKGRQSDTLTEAPAVPPMDVPDAATATEEPVATK